MKDPLIHSNPGIPKRWKSVVGVVIDQNSERVASVTTDRHDKKNPAP